MADETSTLTSSPNTALHNRHLRRVKLSEQQLETISHEELLRSWRELDSYVDMLESQLPSQEEFTTLRKSEDRLRQQYLESSHREKMLVRRLAAKEQEMQEYVSQITELKAAQAPGAAALRSALLDPAVNLLLQRLRQELLATRARLEETQNELSAWKFTPDSNTGKRLMAKCRLLYQENEELGRMINSGRLAKLEGDLALQKSFSEEVKKSQSELDEFLQDLDEDVEGMQGTIYFLQQELRKAKDTVVSLQQENAFLKSGGASKESGQLEEEGDSEMGGASRSRTPVLCDNETQQKVEDDSRDWEAQPGSNQVTSRDSPTHTKSQNAHPEQTLSDVTNTDTETTNKEVIEQSGSSETRTTSDASKENERKDTGDRSHTFNESSSDSGELILKLDSEDIGEEEVESRDSTNNIAKKGKPERCDAERDSQIKTKKSEEHLPGSPESAPRKRNYQSDDSSGDDSDNVPLIKKVRRDSEISLHYNEDDDETGLTNGDANAPGNTT